MQEVKMTLHDEHSEMHVVGALLSSDEIYYSVADRIKPYFFYNPKIARTVRIIIDLHNNGESANIVTVSNHILSHPDVNNPEMWEIAEWSSTAILSAFADAFDVVEEMYVRRRYFALGTKLMDFGTNPTSTFEEIQKEISSVLEEGSEKKKRVKSLRDANKELKQRVIDNYEGTSDTMIPTGFKEIDDKGGLQTGDFDVIAAESSQGKTSLLTCMMVNAAVHGVPSMLFSMEMQSSQIAARIAAPKAKISSGVIQYKKLSDWQMNEFSQAIKQTDDLPIYFDDESTVSFDSIVASIRTNVKRLGIKLVGIDYLQILTATGKNTNQEQFLGYVCRRLKNLAKELQICIVALSQLARNINDPKPTVSRIRASGQILEACDCAIMIWRPSEYGKGYDEYPSVPTQDTAELIFGKGRNIGTFTCIVGFDKNTTNFYNYDGEVKKVGEIKITGKSKKEDEKKEELPFKQEDVVPGTLPF